MLPPHIALQSLEWNVAQRLTTWTLYLDPSQSESPYVSLDRWLNLSVLQFSHVKYGQRDSPCNVLSTVLGTQEGWLLFSAVDECLDHRSKDPSSRDSH